jgi:VCBS repeat-containing protein
VTKAFFSLASGDFVQDWTDTTLITTTTTSTDPANTGWERVASIVGYLGDITSSTTAFSTDLTIQTGANLGSFNVFANQTSPTFSSGGVAEFQLANPTIALQGSGTADVPSIVVYLDATGRQGLHIDLDLRHLDADVTGQQFNIQYRVGDAGTWTNVPGGFNSSVFPTATSPSTVHVSLDLPSALDNQEQVELRLMTQNAQGSDELIGLDNIHVSSTTAVVDTIPPTLSSTTPAEGALVDPAANLTLQFSESVKAGAGTFTITGDAGDVHVISASDAGQVTFAGTVVTINPTADLNISEGYHLSVSGDAVTDKAGNAYAGTGGNPVDFATYNPTPKIYDIQGAGHTSPLVGLHVTTSGVVTAIDATGSRGFWIQDQTGDGNDATSDAVFVFTNAVPTVHVGDLVQVAGTVNEFAGSDANNLTITEVGSSNANVTVEGSGFTIAPTIIGETGRHIPSEVIDNDHFATFDPGQDAIDFYESLEGMVVTVPNAQAVDSTFLNETFVVADNGAGATGMNSRGGITIADGDMNPERIEIFADSGVSNITLNTVAGDHLGDVTGVLSYFGGNYELLPLSVGSTASIGAAPRETTALAADASHLTIGEYNLENIDPTDPDAKFAALAADIAHNLGAPDIMALEEIQDADGAGPGTDFSGTATLTKLVAAIDAAGGPHYQFVEIAPTANNQNGGEPNGNIRQAYLYDASKVSYVDGSAHQILDDNPLNGDAYNNSRRPLVADFKFHGETVTVIDLHNFSRGGSDELFGQDQPPINSGDQRRIDQTAPVEHYVQQVEAADPGAHIVVTGDFNGYQFETAQTQLETGGILTNLTNQLDPTDRYSFIFEGNMEQIDHMYASPSLVGGAQFDIVHLNTGQTDTRPTDHDPTLGRFLVNTAPVGVADNAYAGSEDTVLTVDAAHGVLANDTDLNGDVLKAAVAQGPTHGTLTLNADGSFAYTPGADFNGADSFTYIATDPTGAASAETTVSLQIAPVNDAPVAHDDTGVVAENQSVGIDVLANDTDVDTGDTKTLLSVSGTALGGHVSIVDGQVVYSADADAFDLLTSGQHVTDSFTYVVADAAGATSTATVSVTVNGVDNAPTQNAGNGNSTLTGTAGDEVLHGGNGSDKVSGADGADTLTGDNGNDTLLGGAGVDNLDGGNGADSLDGGAGADTLEGDNGVDTLVGGAGDDRLTGDNGNDVFVFHAGFGHDTVTDFSHGDQIQVDRALLADFTAVMDHAHQVGADVVITLDGADSVTLQHVQLSALHSNDFIFA